MHTRQAKTKGWWVQAIVLGAIGALAPRSAYAHFVLEAPASWDRLDLGTGLPEKLGPCGDENTPIPWIDDAGSPMVTAFQEGDSITVTINEVVFHPGHYRISLSTDWPDAGDTVQSGFPPDPVFTTGDTNSGTKLCPGGGTSPCGSVPIVENTPVAVPGVGWILADNIFEHCDQFTGPQTIKIPLPAGVTCKECVVQVLEFMSAHGLNDPGACFYHHCANISISGQSVVVEAGAGSGGSGSAVAGSGASTGEASGQSSGTEGASTGSTAVTGSTSGSVVTTGAGSSAGSTSSAGVSAVSGSGPGSGSSSGTSAAISPPSSGGGCSVSPGRGFAAALLAGLVAAAGLVRRRRR
jgi:hypothetical protein